DGSAGNGDLIEGGSGSNIITGSAFADTIYADAPGAAAGDGGINLINAGAGDDSIFGVGGSHSEIHGQDGNDIIVAGDGSTVMVNGSPVHVGDLIFGENGTDSITGGAGDDTISGDAGNDTITGGGGNDLIWGGSPEFIPGSQTDFDYPTLFGLIYN